MIAFGVMWTLCKVDRRIDGIHSQQVWVSGYKPQGNNQMTLLFVKALSYWIAIIVMWILSKMNRRLIGLTVSRYEFQDIKLQWNNKMTHISMKALPDMPVM